MGGDPATGLDEVSDAKCEDVRSMSDRRLMARLGTTPRQAMPAIDQVLRYLLRL